MSLSMAGPSLQIWRRDGESPDLEALTDVEDHESAAPRLFFNDRGDGGEQGRGLALWCSTLWELCAALSSVVQHLGTHVHDCLAHASYGVNAGPSPRGRSSSMTHPMPEDLQLQPNFA